MRIIDSVPKEIHIITEIKLTELMSLKVILDNMQFNYDGENPEHVKAEEYLTQVLYPTVNSYIREMVINNGIRPDA